MRVLVVTNMYPTNDVSYSGIFIKEHVESMRKIGIEVDVFYTNPSHNRIAYFYDIPKLVNLMRTGVYDIVHAVHTYSALQVLFVKTLIRNKTPVLLTNHEGEALSPKNYVQKIDLLKRIVYIKSIKRWVAERVNYVIFVEKKIPIAIGYKGNYHVIPPGVNIDLFIPMDQPHCRSRLSLPSDKKILFFPANPLIWYKGFDSIQEAIKLVSEPIRLITGGNIKHSMMPLYINASDIVIQASIFEASPMIVKETLACNRTMLFTDVGDVKEIFGNTPGYFLIDLEPQKIAQKIVQALDFGPHTNGRDRLLSLGLSLEQTAYKYKEIIEKTIVSK